MKLSSFVSKKKFSSARIQFKEVNFAIMSDCGLNLIKFQIKNTNSKIVKQICNNFSRLPTSKFLIRIIESCRNHIRTHIFSSTSSNSFIYTIFNDCKLPSIEYHDNVWIRKIKFLISTSSPWKLR